MMRIILLGIMISMIYSCTNFNESNDQTFEVIQLKTEKLNNPLGVDVDAPLLSWQLRSNRHGNYQSAYHILVASSVELLNRNEADIWDTKKVLSDQSINIKYKGNNLISGEKYYWKVMTWDKDSVASEWSKPAFWTVGLLNEHDWHAKWIGTEKVLGNDKPYDKKTKLAARYLRNEFNISKEIQSATAYISGLGLSELYLNGNKIGDHVLSPGQTQFEKRVLYVTHDVTSELKQGKNAIGVILGNGRYFKMRYEKPMFDKGFGFPKLLMQIRINFEDGTDTIIISDENWKLTANGPIYENNEYDGEKYDAQKELTGWDKSGYDDSRWMPVELVQKPTLQLSSQMNEPIRITEIIKPLTVNEPKPGTFIFDLGQNIAGWVKLTVKGNKGDTIKLQFAEVLNDDGTLYQDNLRSAEATDIYICKGEGTEIWEPRFTYHGFRFVELSGYPGKPDLNTIEGRVIHDDVKLTGSFNCSNPLINQIYKNSVWGIRDNYRSFPTDCPQRDERAPWLGDRAAGSLGESYIFDISKLYSKWMRDICDAQLEWGSISDISPSYSALFHDNVTWEGSPIILTNMLYEQYGDLKLIKNSYPFLIKWYKHMANNYLKNGLMPRDTYGDWCMPPELPELIHSKDRNRITNGTYLGTSFFYYMSVLMHQFSETLNLPDDQKYFEEKENEIRSAFQSYFFNELDTTYTNNTVTANILALAFGLVPSQYESKIINNIVEKIETQHQGHIPVGLVGSQFLMRTLTEYGRGDLAYRFATQTDYPSWGYMVKQGATTIWELWNGDTADPSMNSRNHVMLLGDFNSWLYGYLAGIRAEKPAFKTIRFQPYLIQGLNFIEADFESRYGKITSNWKIKNDEFIWEIEIPTNSDAVVYVPATQKSLVKINNKNIAESKIVNELKYETNYVVFHLSSGKYKLTSTDFLIQKVNQKRADFPQIIATETTSENPIHVELTCPMDSSVIYYTTDGTIPTENSHRYIAPFNITKTSVLNVRAFKKSMIPSFIYKQVFDIYNAKLNGLTYSYYEGKWDKIPDFSQLKSKSTSKINNIEDLDKIKQRDDYWAIKYSGKITIEKTGEHWFAINSDDGTRLYIDNKLIIDNDGVHGEFEMRKSVILEEGIHSITLEYFEGNYNELLELKYGRKEWPLSKIPQSMLLFN